MYTVSEFLEGFYVKTAFVKKTKTKKQNKNITKQNKAKHLSVCGICLTMSKFCPDSQTIMKLPLPYLENGMSDWKKIVPKLS